MTPGIPPMAPVGSLAVTIAITLLLPAVGRSRYLDQPGPNAHAGAFTEFFGINRGLPRGVAHSRPGAAGRVQDLLSRFAAIASAGRLITSSERNQPGRTCTLLYATADLGAKAIRQS